MRERAESTKNPLIPRAWRACPGDIGMAPRYLI